ncbi:putative pectin lyase F-2 [Aspergillus ambiguus]|uniref:polysaccharide lyase family 1 protein n=1 Tax=Aspergillus ambiguus TaxID=176160 RepID=UPI003CCDCAA6
MSVLRSIVAAAALLTVSARAQRVVGKPFGFAAGTTGGGAATPAAPSDITQLAKWLSDDTPRVILIDKEFDFTGSEGTCSDCSCCIPSSNTCGSSGQNAIATDFGWCGNSPNITCTYDTAGTEGLEVASDKSIVGVGSAGVIRGKGLRMTGGVSNIIIQNIHITEINPEYIWGGDAISLDGTDKIWIDHVKVSLVGRQMFVSGYESSGSVTISNSEFDGRTDWSASCDGHHYWTLLGLGENEQITFARNYIHHTSGRSPKLGETSYWHAYNNYWSDNTGHAFDAESTANALIEGNVFSNVNTPLMEENLDAVFAVSADDESSCSGALGRSCIPNILTNSGELSSAGDGVFSGWLSDEGALSLMPASQVAAYVMDHAGVGKPGAGDYSSSVAIPSSTPAPSSSALAKRHGRHDRHDDDGVRPGRFPRLTEAGPGASRTPGPAPSWTWRTVGVPTPKPTPCSSTALGKPTGGHLPPRFPIFGDLGIF